MAGRYRYEDDDIGVYVERFGHSPDNRGHYRTRSGQMVSLESYRRDNPHERTSPIHSPVQAPIAPRYNTYEGSLLYDSRFLIPHRPSYGNRRYSTPAELGYRSAEDLEIIQIQRDLERQKLADREELRQKALRREIEREMQDKANAQALAEADYQRRLTAEIEKQRRDADDAKRDIKNKLDEEIRKRDREAEEKRVKKKEEEERAVAEYKAKEEEKAAAEKKAKDEFNKNFKEKMEKDLKRAGISDKEIARIVKEEDVEGKPMYTRIALRWIEVETLNRYGPQWMYDPDSRDHILVKRSVAQWELDIWFNHTDRIRRGRRPSSSSSSKLVVVQPSKLSTSLPILVIDKRKSEQKKPKKTRYYVVREP